MANGNQFNLPAGFELDEPLAPDETELPDGFVLDDDRPAPTAEEAGQIQQQRIEDLPELSGILSGEDKLKSFALSPVLMATTNPDEFAGIITSNFPNIKAVYPGPGQDPLLFNNETQRAVRINREGFSPVDALQAAGIASAFLAIPGVVSGVSLPALAKAAGIGGAGQAVIEGAQSLVGGEFDSDDVAVSAATGPIAQLGAEKVIYPAIGAAAKAITPAAQKAREIVSFSYQTPAKQRISELIEQGVPDVSTAAFKLEEPSGVVSRLFKSIKDQGPRVVKDKAAVEAIKQGFDEGVIAAIKGASKADKNAMAKMADVMQKGIKNKRFAATNRPSDVVGDTLMSRLNIIRAANKKAGAAVNASAKDLRGQSVDSLPIGQEFAKDLSEMGVNIGDDLKLSFAGSDIEGLAGPERAIKSIFDRMTKTGTPDAYELHRLKRFIDEQVTYGKNAEGLAGRAEGALKKLRSSIDATLDKKFPAYDKANQAYSETIGALDAFQDVAGRKMDLTGPNAEKATGQLMRRLMSNTQSRVNLFDSVEQIDYVSKRYAGDMGQLKLEGGKEFKNDLISQVLFVDELDRLFGPVARTSFQGQIDQAIQRGARAATGGASEVAIESVAKGAEKLRGINNENAFKAINKLLKESK